jgi:outer membrane protein OmpA-like peptidoglycan-associated protein
MLGRAISVGVAVLVLAAPAAAQQRGTVEFGAFASRSSFDQDLGMNSGWGGGGRIGAYLHPRWLLEFEAGGTSAPRNLGLQNVNVGILSARLAAVPVRLGALSFLLGAGVDHTDTYIIESYGVHGLLGAKVDLSDYLALRLDGIQSYMAHGKYTNTSLHAGLSFTRNPFNRVTTVSHMVEAPYVPQRPDSVSAYETRRLRAASADYAALRDSLARAGNRYVPPSSAASLATMQQMIYFRNDRSDLSDSAKSILSDKVTVFRANPAMRIVIVGFASQPGTDAYNMALGLRRAEAAKAHLVSLGIDPIRIEIATRGEGQLVVDGPGEVADAANRRGQFRLLIADPYLAPPKY